MIQADGSRGRVHRSAVLGLVSEVPTRRRALVLLEERLRPLNRGLRAPQSTMRFRDFAQNEWSTLVLPTLKLSTQTGYRLVLTRHLLPYFGESQLCDITKLDVQQFVAEKFRQGLAWQTARNAWIVLSTILDSAVQYSYLVMNPARGVKFPPQAPHKERRVLTAEDVTKLLSQLREPVRTIVTLAALTGLRVGELLALRWRAVDLDSGALRITESVYEGKFQKPKSEKSVRTIPVGPFVRWLLTGHRRRSLRPAPEDLVFPNRRGGALNGRNLMQRLLEPAGEAAGIGRVTWHQFRHFHSSLLHDLGVPAKVAQQQLGHATIETTLNIYTHAIPETHRHAVEHLERVLFPNVPNLPGVKEVPVC